MSDRNIFFDLDGTLLDVRARLYNLFIELAPETLLSLNEYWEIKRNRVDQANLLRMYLGYSKGPVATFKKMWLSRVEEGERLMQDVPFNCAGPLLEKLSIANCLYIVTNRQNRDLTLEQINSFGWTGYIREVLVTEQKTSKLSLIKENVKISRDDVLIGDTGEDIITGKELGARTIAVASGSLGKNLLLEYDPDFVVDSIAEIYADSSMMLS